MRLAISTTETLTDLKTDLVVANNNNNLRSGECDVSLYVLCCSVNGSVSIVCYVSDRVCELFGETIRNMFGCVCYFVVV